MTYLEEQATNIDAALIESVKIDARGRMRHDNRVWHEALESALDTLLPSLIEAVRADQREEDALMVEEMSVTHSNYIAARIRNQK